MTQANTPITPGSGLFVLSDTVTDASLGNQAAQVQYVKEMDGTPGSTNKRFINPSGADITAPYPATPLGYQQIATLATAQSLTIPSGATFAVIIVENITVRWRDDGTLPTASIGMPMYAGQAPMIFAGDLSAARFIQESGGNGGSTLNVSYYK